jgi:hypothetical protein
MTTRLAESEAANPDVVPQKAQPSRTLLHPNGMAVASI